MTTDRFIEIYGGSYENGRLVCSGSLYLSGTQIAALPDNLTVGGSLDLSGTQIAALPDNLTVGGYLDLRGTQIAALPDNLTVGGSLYLRGTQIAARDAKNVRKLKDGDFARNRYIYADGILTHIVGRPKTINDYTFYKGRIPGQNVVSAVVDGKTIYAHCKTLEEGARNIADKLAESLGEDQYRNWTRETLLSREDARRAYHIIARACYGGIDRFIASLGDQAKDQYTVEELAELTRGQYGGDRFSAFIESLR